VRIFVAIKLEEKVKKELSKVQEEMKRRSKRIKWVSKENLHLTLKFLGEVEETKIEEVEKKIEEGITGEKKFKLSFEGIGYFPNKKTPRIIWIGVDEGRDNFIRIAEKLNKNLNKFRKEEKKIIPHLTLGRVKYGGEVFIEEKNFKTSSFLVTKVSLIKSKLLESGPLYTVIKEFPLI
jgi:2'-5' RNA ligase